MNKKIIFLVMILLLFTSVCFAATADVQLNGSIIDFTDKDGEKVDAQIINNRTLVPLRKIFEELGCNVEWEQETRTAIATKDNLKLILQIDNKNVKKIVDGKESTIVLDVPPTIYNNRTLVPLRFIAESLDKQVGWDASNYTAIIIDYDYFSNSLKTKAKYLYEILENGYDNFDVEIVRNYYDEVTPNNNDIANIKANVHKNGEFYTVQIGFSGSNDLMKEIVEEGWDNIDLRLKYDSNGVVYSTTNTTLAKMLAISPNEQNNVNYSSINLSGNTNNNFANAIRNIIDLKDNELNINSFRDINEEWNKILSKVSYDELNGTFRVSNIEDIDFKYFDFTRLDNIIYGNSINKIYNIINKKIFNYDIQLDELLYDMSSMEINGTVIDNGKKATITFNCANDYKEKIVYSIIINIK